MIAIFYAHSGLRYLVLLMGLVVMLHAAFRLARGRGYDDTARRLATIFSGVVDVQVLLGIILVFTRPFYPALIGHIVLMLSAAVVAHLPVVINKRRPESEQSIGLQLALTGLALLLMTAGILAIGRGILETSIR
jgi:heme A synthase